MMYQPICKASQLELGTGDLVIVTGWTPRERIAKLLAPDRYACIGQLYSPTQGIDLLLRNLLANPSVSRIALLCASKADRNSGSVQQLYDLLTARRGLNKLSSDLPVAAVQELCNSLQVSFFDRVDLLIDYANAIPQRLAIANRPRLALMPPQTELGRVLPSQVIGQRVVGGTVAQAWPKLLQRIRQHGLVSDNAYGGQWQELLDLVVVVTDEPASLPSAKTLGLTGLGDYVAQICDDSVSETRYTYGQRLRSWFGRDQVSECIAKLRANPKSTRAVMTLWHADDLDIAEPPCLNHISLRVIGNRLLMTATFRSNDMYNAWPANALGLRALQYRMANELGIGVAELVTVSQSAHVYDDCFDLADVQLDRKLSKTFDDPCGNFLVFYDETDERISVEQLQPDTGIVVAKYTGNAKQCLDKIAHANPSLDVAHAMYLGRELERCERLGTSYEQDR